MAMQAKAEVESASRKPEMLEHFMAKAAKDHSRAGPSTSSQDAEERRKQWVDKRLIEYGRMRARTLGWPDVYTFTKAMGERAVEDIAHERRLPLSIVRPSIIESALRAPVPRLDRRLQDGGPHHPRVRAGPDPGVPGHPGRDRRPDPGGLRGERDPGGRRDAPTAGRAGPLQRLQRRPQPAPLLRALRVGPRVLRGASAARTRARGAQGPRVEVPRQHHRGADAAPRGAADRRRGEDRDAPAEVPDDARRRLTAGPRQGARRLREALFGSLRDVHRDRGRLHGRTRGGPLELPDVGGPGALPVRRRRDRLEALSPGRAQPRRDAVAPRAQPS